MAEIRELLKNRELFVLNADESIESAAVHMMEHNVGAAPVVEGLRLVGVLSERDIVRRVMMGGRDWRTTPVSAAMTRDPLTVKMTEDVHECMLLMKHHGFRHLPVMNGSELRGFVSMRDLLLYDLDEKEIEVRMMRAYMSAGSVE